jgi:calcium-translocating P-type ATPase
MSAGNWAVTPYLAGDPVRVGPEVVTLAALAAALGLAEPGALPLCPGVVLVHALGGTAQRLTVRWVQLPHEPVLAPGLEAAATAIAVESATAEGGRAVRLVGRLRAGLGDPAVLRQASQASTREDLVTALRVLDASRQESGVAPGELLALLGSSIEGLATEDADRRRAVAGPNRLPRVRRRPLAIRFLEQFTGFFAVLLWIASVLASLAGLPELAAAMVVVIVVNGLGSFLQEYRAERALRALEQLLPHTIATVRDGRLARLATSELVPGDLVRLAEGDLVPADAQLLASEGLRVDQSALTGEPQPVFKLPAPDAERTGVPRLERPELVFAGTNVVAGSGDAVVVATGLHTEIGEVARLTQAVGETPSPLQREMARVTRVVTGLAVVFGVVFFVLGVAAGVLRPAEGLIFALGVIVANVPEGLLPTLTLALALGAQRMARAKGLVKRLSAVETLGATTVICTDKTGTLTEGRMAARALWVAGGMLRAEAVTDTPSADLRALLSAAVLASHAGRAHGDPTEVGLVLAAEAAGLDADKTRLEHPLVAVLPFDSFRRRMTMVRRTDRADVAYVKGAPRETLALCDRIRNDGRVVRLDDDQRRAILADHDRLAADGLRILAVAERPLPDTTVRTSPSAVEQDLVFLGLVALWDPPRPEVPAAIGLCQSAGIHVVMVTGDYGLTAQAIAARIGLAVETVVGGDEVERMGRDALRRLVGRPGLLFARVSPAHKLAIVEALRAEGEVVTVTGDGVNDAPALKAADIGVAMGRRGTEVAREAAEIVLTDDNFASIVTAVRQGRAIYANMGKFVTYIFASNVPELVPFLAFVFLGIPLPLTIMQILAVDLGTDLVPALALGAEPPEPGVMDRPPRHRDERLLGARRLLHAYGFLGVIESALALGAFFWTYWLAGWRPGLPMAASGNLYVRATTMTLAGIVAAQVGNVVACRTDRQSIFRVGLATNTLVFAGVAVEIGILLMLIFVPPLPHLFGLAPLSFPEWGVLLAFPFVLLGLEEARKWAVRRIEHRRHPAHR